jgi:hypothetical protein
MIQGDMVKAVGLREKLPQNFEKIAGGAVSCKLTEGVLNSSLLFNAGGIK